MSKPCIEFVVKAGADEIMVHWPSGRVEFFGWFAALKLAWRLLRRDAQVVVVDGDKP